jgi:hypothetical protein
MCKTIKNQFDNKLTFQKLLEAHERASKGKKSKKEVILFEMDLETNIVKILNDIKNNNYKFGKYREFYVYEPKRRLIKSLPYRDRIVHQWYVEEFIKPYFCKRFISTTFACLDNRGTHKSVYKLQSYMRKMYKNNKNYYVLKCDISKFFYSIDKNILFDILSSHISDKKLLSFSLNILNDNSDLGIPIGNYTSQYFANIFLNELDQFVKNSLKIKYYVRYMDDFIMLLNTKEEAKNIYKKINIFLNEKLNLKLNKKSKYFPSKLGIDFCGYHIFESYLLVRKRFKKKINKTIKLWKYLKSKNKLDFKKQQLSGNSLSAYMKHANSFNYKKKINNILNESKLNFQFK